MPAGHPSPTPPRKLSLVQIENDVELARRTTMGVGGPARFFCRVETDTDLCEALEFAETAGKRVFVLGGGSNVVIADGGVDGLVVAMDLRGVDVRQAGSKTRVTARAGESWDSLVDHTITLGLAGLECLSGIPGLVGATPIQNVGAYGQEVADSLVELRAFDRLARDFVMLAKRDCAFGYRDSRFKSAQRDRFIITDVTFELEEGAPTSTGYAELERALAQRDGTPTLRDVRESVIQLRRAKSMVIDPSDENTRSCGSFFVNPKVSEALASKIEQRFAPMTMPRYPQETGWVKLSAAWLIERAGLAKGTRAGNVGISTRHALALVSHAGATARELLSFADFVRDQVLENTGVELTPEPEFW
jgi:UDP-N-acetylmuramate dehydrogenase